jgi:hypothetical protein
MNGKLQTTISLAPLVSIQRKSPGAFKEGSKRGAIQFLNWANTGSSARSSRKPPIKWGVLRGSSSAFVGSELVSKFSQQIDPGAPEQPTPAVSHSAPPGRITWVWNTEYAKRMHEWEGGWGPATERDMDAGNQWLLQHLQKDKDDLMAVIGKEVKRILGT